MVTIPNNNGLKLKKILLEVLKAVILHVIYLYDLQLCKDNVHPIYTSLDSINGKLSKIEKSQTINVSEENFNNINGIGRSKVGYQIPIYLTLDNNGFANLNASLSDVRFKLSLLNTLISLNTCFNTHFDITLDDINAITTGTYSLTKAFVNKLSIILSKYGSSGYNDIDKIMLNSAGIENALINMTTCVATFAKIGLPFLEQFKNFGFPVTTIRTQFVAQIPLFMSEIYKFLEANDTPYLKQASLLLRLSQETNYGTAYDFHKVCDDCVIIKFYKDKGKCDYYALNGIKYNLEVATEQEKKILIINLGNDSQFRKIIKKMNDYLVYINFLLEFRRLFSGDIIDIQKLSKTKVSASITLLTMHNEILNKIKNIQPTGKKTHVDKLFNKLPKFQTKKANISKTSTVSDFKPAEIFVLFDMMNMLFKRYLTECSLFNKKIISHEEGNQEKYEKVIERYKAELKTYAYGVNMSLEESINLFIKHMDVAFKIYKLRAYFMDKLEGTGFNRYEYTGMQNNVKKLKMVISPVILREKPVRKSNVPKIMSYHSESGKSVKKILAIEAPNQKTKPQVPPKPKVLQNPPRKPSSYNTIEESGANETEHIEDANAPLLVLPNPSRKISSRDSIEESAVNETENVYNRIIKRAKDILNGNKNTRQSIARVELYTAVTKETKQISKIQIAMGRVNAAIQNFESDVKTNKKIDIAAANVELATAYAALASANLEMDENDDARNELAKVSNELKKANEEFNKTEKKYNTLGKRIGKRIVKLGQKGKDLYNYLHKQIQTAKANRKQKKEQKTKRITALPTSLRHSQVKASATPASRKSVPPLPTESQDSSVQRVSAAESELTEEDAPNPEQEEKAPTPSKGKRILDFLKEKGRQTRKFFVKQIEGRHALAKAEKSKKNQTIKRIRANTSTTANAQLPPRRADPLPPPPPSTTQHSQRQSSHNSPRSVESIHTESQETNEHIRRQVSRHSTKNATGTKEPSSGEGSRNLSRTRSITTSRLSSQATFGIPPPPPENTHSSTRSSISRSGSQTKKVSQSPNASPVHVSNTKKTKVSGAVRPVALGIAQRIGALKGK